MKKFAKATEPDLTDAEMAEQQAANLQWRVMDEQAHAEAADVFEAYQNLDGGEFLEYLANHPPAPIVILKLIGIALAADDPYKMNLLGRKKADAVYGPAKKAALVAYEQYRQSTNNKGKTHFANLQAKVLKTTAGKPIKASTIYRWLPKIKK